MSDYVCLAPVAFESKNSLQGLDLTRTDVIVHSLCFVDGSSSSILVCLSV